VYHSQLSIARRRHLGYGCRTFLARAPEGKVFEILDSGEVVPWETLANDA
jgi:hypothetical protein